MLEGWYCRSLANQKTPTGNNTEREQLESDDELQSKPSGTVSGAAPAASSSASTGTANANVDYKERYRNLKRKLKFLIYVSKIVKIIQNESFNRVVLLGKRVLSGFAAYKPTTLTKGFPRSIVPN